MVSNLDGDRDRGQKQTDVIIMDFAKAQGTTQEAIVQIRLLRDKRIYSQVDQLVAL